jgi:uncharacterized YigZ family protein
MSIQEPYLVPAVENHRIETVVARSRFIATVSPVTTVKEAKAFLARIRAEMPDASHHVYAFRVGYGASVTEGKSDDGEPSGTAGPPVLAILRGSGIGDIAIVVTRYFGGTKLGTGGLVRAYSEATHVAINSLKTELKVEKKLIGIEMPYRLFELVKRLIFEYNGVIEDEDFAGDVTIMATFPTVDIAVFSSALSDLSSGSIEPVFMDDD